YADSRAVHFETAFGSVIRSTWQRSDLGCGQLPSSSRRTLDIQRWIADRRPAVGREHPAACAALEDDGWKHHGLRHRSPLTGPDSTYQPPCRRLDYGPR